MGRAEYIIETEEPSSWLDTKERIVRCKDCKYGKRIDCARRCYRQIGTPAVGDDGFCAWGEPRE